jgi:hypothetical protein
MVRSVGVARFGTIAPSEALGIERKRFFSPGDGNVLSTLTVMGNENLSVVFWQLAKRSAKHESRNCSIRFAMTNPSDGYEWSITHFGDFFGAPLQIVR